jgi:peptidoglycan/xylan/chitin deacetylase (PgdA/CDA1 family)
MEVGAHGHTHRTFAQLGDADTESDLRISKEILEDRLGTAIRSLAYPKGRPRRDFTESTMKVARGIGYERAGAVLFRGVRPSDPLMSIPRFPVEDDTLDILDAKISGRLDLIGGWQEHAPLWLLRALGR